MSNKIIPAILLIFISLPAFSFGKVEKNPQKLKEIYDIGRETAMTQVSQMKEFLNT